jgi:hypothetical protein
MLTVDPPVTALTTMVAVACALVSPFSSVAVAETVYAPAAL